MYGERERERERARARASELRQRGATATRSNQITEPTGLGHFRQLAKRTYLIEISTDVALQDKKSSENNQWRNVIFTHLAKSRIAWLNAERRDEATGVQVI